MRLHENFEALTLVSPITGYPCYNTPPCITLTNIIASMVSREHQKNIMPLEQRIKDAALFARIDVAEAILNIYSDIDARFSNVNDCIDNEYPSP